MTEPKYKLYDIVTIPMENGERRNAIISFVYPNVKGVPLYSITPDRESDDEYMFHEDELQPVKIYHDYGKVFCKDCRHTIEVDANSLLDEPWLTVYRDACPKMTGLVRIGYENVFPSCYENDQPPCDCCFVPRISTNPQTTTKADDTDNKTLISIKDVEIAIKETK